MGFLDGLGTLVGGAGNAGAASNNAWQYGQYQPFSVNNPMGQLSYDGTNASMGLSGPQQGLQNNLLNQANTNLTNGSANYNPNTGFLPQQYQSIYGNMQGNVNSMFNNLQQAQAPWMAQQRQSGLDNEFSKGTLASTAGGYQTAGIDMAQNSQMNTNMAQAQQYALNNANAQFGAASNTAQQGEQQAEFAPQLSGQQTNSAVQNSLQQNSLLQQLLATSGNLGAQRSGSNVAAATPGIQTGMIQDQSSAGLLQGLLFGGGSQGGLLSSLLGTGGAGGGLLSGLGGIGSSLGSLLGLGGNVQSPGGTQGNMNTPGYDTSPMYTSPDTQVNDGGSGTTTWWGDSGDGQSFNGAGGQAADSGSSASGASSGGGLGGLGAGLASAGGIFAGLSKGGASGDIQAGGNAARLYNQITGNSGGFAGLAGQAGQALNVYNGLTSGNPGGVVQGLSSGASLAASSGAASALGASPSAVAALGTAASGVGAVLAIPAVTQGVGSILFHDILGVDKPDKEGNELASLRDNVASGVTEKAASAGVSQGGFLSAAAPASQGVRDFYDGVDISDKLQNPTVTQQAADLFKAGNMTAYNQYMKSLAGK